jgi:hypothetical protein
MRNWGLTNSCGLCYNLAVPFSAVLFSFHHVSMSRFSLDTRLAKDSSQIIERVVAGEALLINLASGDYYSLDSVGTKIWENIDGHRTVEDLADLICAEYNADKGQVVVDVQRLVEHLADEGLLTSQ